MDAQTEYIDRLYRPAELAKKRGVPPSSVTSAIARGHLESWITGCGTHLITKDDFNEWVKKGSKLGRPREF